MILRFWYEPVPNPIGRFQYPKVFIPKGLLPEVRDDGEELVVVLSVKYRVSLLEERAPRSC